MTGDSFGRHTTLLASSGVGGREASEQAPPTTENSQTQNVHGAHVKHPGPGLLHWRSCNTCHAPAQGHARHCIQVAPQ